MLNFTGAGWFILLWNVDYEFTQNIIFSESCWIIQQKLVCFLNIFYNFVYGFLIKYLIIDKICSINFPSYHFYKNYNQQTDWENTIESVRKSIYCHVKINFIWIFICIKRKLQKNIFQQVAGYMLILILYSSERIPAKHFLVKVWILRIASQN